MSTTTATLKRIDLPLAGAVTAAVAAGLMAKAYLTGEDHNTFGEYAVVLGVIAVFTIVAFAGALPRAGTKTSWALGVLAVVTLPVYWLGLPLVFGPAAVLTGRLGPQVLGTAGFLVAAVAALLGV